MTNALIIIPWSLLCQRVLDDVLVPFFIFWKLVWGVLFHVAIISWRELQQLQVPFTFPLSAALILNQSYAQLVPHVLQMNWNKSGICPTVRERKGRGKKPLSTRFLCKSHILSFAIFLTQKSDCLLLRHSGVPFWFSFFFSDFGLVRKPPALPHSQNWTL